MKNLSRAWPWLMVVALACLAGACPIQAQMGGDLSFSSSPNPVGSGARAVGRGGAFIAIADDATAASWNPAGLAQLEFPEVSGVGSYLGRHQRMDFDFETVPGGEFSSSTADLNYLSAVYPTEALPVYLVFALNYQRLYEFDRQVDLDFAGPYHLLGLNFNSAGRLEAEQKGALTTITPAVGIEITHRFSVGLAANLWNNQLTTNRWDQWSKSWEQGQLISPFAVYDFTAQGEMRESYRLRGNNLNFGLGFLWDINNVWRVGGVYKSELTARLDHDREIFRGVYFPAVSAWTDVSSSHDSLDEWLHLPPSYGLAVAYQPNDNWSFGLDVYLTDWRRFFLENEDGDQVDLLSAEIHGPEAQPTCQVRLGLEYLLIRERTVYPLRAGLLYDPEPRAGRPQDVYGASLGAGYAKGPLLVDAAVQFRWGQHMAGEKLAGLEATRDLSETLLLLSTIYHFE